MLRNDNRAAGLQARTPTTPSLRPFSRVRSANSDSAPPTASEHNERTDNASQVPQPTMDKVFPKRGLFSIADPNQEVYSKAGERFDPSKKGGRFKPEFIWQTNWQEQLKRQEDLERQQAEYRKRKESGEINAITGPGVVSLNRLGALEDLSVDLSEQLRVAKEKAEQQRKAAAAAAPGSAPASAQRTSSQQQKQQQQAPRQQARAAASPSYQYKDLPTKNEAKRFKRVGRLPGAGTVASISAVGTRSPEEIAARAAAAAVEKQRYEKLKTEFQAWTLALGLLGTATCYYCYTKDVAVSYALGASSGLTYLRLLSKTVDAVGDQGAGAVKTTLGQPRLLIPVVLALTYNRWNQLYADQYGYHLDFYGMLVGFFTYKLAVIGRQGLELFSELSAGSDAAASSSSSSSGADDGGDAMSLDRIFIQKALRE